MARLSARGGRRPVRVHVRKARWLQALLPGQRDPVRIESAQGDFRWPARGRRWPASGRAEAVAQNARTPARQRKPKPQPPAVSLPRSANHDLPAAQRRRRPQRNRSWPCCQLLGPGGSALEIASGTSQHAAWFAATLPGWTWQADRCRRQHVAGDRARIAEADLSNVRPPLRLDVEAPQWPRRRRLSPSAFAIYCANMLHIAPWSACAGLMAGAARQLASGGRLVTYGPFGPTSPRHRATWPSTSLRARDPAWGIRQLDDVAAQAERHGLALQQRHAMPANNLLLVFAAAAS